MRRPGTSRTDGVRDRERKQLRSPRSGTNGDSQDARAALLESATRRWQPTLIKRATAGACILLASFALALLVTLGSRPAPGLAGASVLLVLCVLQLFTVVGIRRLESARESRGLLIVVLCADCMLVTLAGVLCGQPAPAAAFNIVLPMACAATLPWRLRYQALLTSAAFVAILVSAVGAGLTQDHAIVLLNQTVVLLSSVYLAFELERTRLSHMAGELASGQADRRLQDVTADLERRVASRTRELEGRTKELEHVVKELQSISYTVSHDLRAPLRHINGYSTALREEYSQALGAEGCGYLDRMCAATRRMGSMIDSLLRLARVTQTELVPEPVNLSALVRCISADVHVTPPGREVRWIIQDGVWATGDGALLRVAIENLIDNALKFSANQNPAYVEFGLEDGGGEDVYYVRDNGAGFDMRYYDKLFKLFTRLHASDEYEGTGIGLATVQRTIERHGGRVWAQSAVASGATFFFTLGRMAG